jgi:hypothetical protein
MKLFYSFLLVIWFACTINNSSAQRNPGEYIVKDFAYSMGKVVPLSKERIQFQKTKSEKPIIYNANEITEYGYEGNVFESIPIKGDQKFLKRIVSGKINLYQDQKLYALKVDSSFIIFNRKDYRSVISESIKCEGNDRSLSRMTYSKVALSTYIKAYNLGRCNSDNLPYKKFGGYVGYSSLQFDVFFGKSVALKDRIAVPTVGVFCDLPLFRPRSLFLTTEVNWLYGKPLFYRENQNNSDYFGLNINGVNSLVSTKWIISQRKIKAYFKAGAVVSFLNVTSPTGLIQTIAQGSAIDISRQEVSKSSELLYGFNSGIGLEIPYKRRQNFHLEIKYIKTFDGRFDSFKMDFSGFSIVAGFNI